MCAFDVLLITATYLLTYIFSMRQSDGERLFQLVGVRKRRRHGVRVSFMFAVNSVVNSVVAVLR